MSLVSGKVSLQDFIKVKLINIQSKHTRERFSRKQTHLRSMQKSPPRRLLSCGNLRTRGPMKAGNRKDGEKLVSLSHILFTKFTLAAGVVKSKKTIARSHMAK